MTKNPLICVAVCAGAFGVRGEIKVKSFTDEPKDCFAYGLLRGEAGNIFLSITAHRPVKNGFAVFADKVKTREQAQALSGTKLYVYRNDMPDPDEDEFYFEDLIGLEVKTADGKRMGKILAVHNHGAGDLLEISGTKDTPEFYHPFTKKAVPKVDIKARRVVIFIEDVDAFTESP
ncbi:MAG: 16S rRNA processing protein RimM [Robiginitomaculum sp.]|nr:16S rRNA processing protein RimM [Robiginitomaculum sp.]